MRGPILVTLVFGASAAACSLLLGEGLSGGTDSPPDGSVRPGDVQDGGVAEPTADTGAPTSGSCSLPNLLTNGDFEGGQVAPWAGGGRTAEVIALDGGAAVRLCATGTSDVYQLLQELPVSSGTAYALHARVRSADGEPPPSSVAVLVDRSEAPYQAVARTSSVEPESSWACLSSEFTPEQDSGGPGALVIVSAYRNGGRSCVLIDDLSLVVVPDGGLPTGCGCP